MTTLQRFWPSCNLNCSSGKVLGVSQRRSGGTRSAHTSCRVDSALSDGELHTPFYDDELWLTEAPAGKDAEGGTLSSKIEGCSLGGGGIVKLRRRLRLGVACTLEVPSNFCRAWVRLREEEEGGKY
eukprot:4802296-Amphidinium_carterae.1